MAKKSTASWDNPFGGFFDFDGDGKESLSELWIAEQIIKDIEKEDEFIEKMEYECEQYAYTRRNAWRKTVPDGTKFSLAALLTHPGTPPA